MSIEAMVWAMNLAPVPCDKTKPSAACAAVLVGLANHADPDGRGAFPAIDTLVRYTRLSRRTVITALDRLESDRIITPCDPDLVAAKIKRADRRPNGYDLDMERYRDDLSDDELANVARANPMLRGAIAAIREARGDGVQSLHLVPDARGAVDAERGETGAERGATSAPRGAVAAPEPTKNPPNEPTTESSDDGVADATPGDDMTTKGTRLPPDWQPSERLKDWYREQPYAHSINPVVETEKFKDHFSAAPGRYGVKRNWDSTWRNWMRTAAERRSGGSRAPQHPQVDAQHRERVGGLF